MGEGGRDRRARRAARLRLDLGVRPLPQRPSPGARSRVRVLDDDGGDQPAHESHPARSDGRLQLVPPAERAGEDHLDDRRHQRRPSRLGDRRRLVRERVPRLRLRVPARRRCASGCCARVRRDRAVDVDRARRRPTRASYYSLSRAHCDPKPLQDPHPPIWIGGGGRAAHAARRRPPCRLLQLRRQAGRVRREVRAAQGPLQRRRS